MKVQHPNSKKDSMQVSLVKINSLARNMEHVMVALTLFMPGHQ